VVAQDLGNSNNGDTKVPGDVLHSRRHRLIDLQKWEHQQYYAKRSPIGVANFIGYFLWFLRARQRRTLLDRAANS